MRYAFIQDNTYCFPLILMCRVLEVSKSGYYSWLRNGGYLTKPEMLLLTERITKLFNHSRKRFGSPRVYQSLKSEGVKVCKTTVEKIMKKHGLVARKRKRYISTTESNHGNVVAPNILNRNFKASRPGEVLLSDITYIPMPQDQFIYLCVVMDLASRQIVGWMLSERIDTDLVSESFKIAINTLGTDVEGGIFHSDQGSQYTADSFVRLVSKSRMRQSMSRRGQCWDNAPMESFFSSLKTELENVGQFQSFDEAKSSLFDYIEIFYNRNRPHSGIGGQTPAYYQGVA